MQYSTVQYCTVRGVVEIGLARGLQGGGRQGRKFCKWKRQKLGQGGGGGGRVPEHRGGG